MKATAGILFLVIVTVFLYVNAEPLPRKTTTTKPKRSSPRSLPSNKKVKGTTTALTTTTTSTTSTENATITTTELLTTTTTTTTTTLPPPTTTTRITTTSRPKTTTTPQIPTAVLVMTYRSKNKTRAVGTSGVEYADADDLTQESSKVTRVSDSRSVNKSIKSVPANHDLNHLVNISDKSKCIGKNCSGKQTDFSSPPLTVAEATIVGVSIALGALVLTATCIYVYVSTERLKIQPEKRCLGSTS